MIKFTSKFKEHFKILFSTLLLLWTCSFVFRGFIYEISADKCSDDYISWKIEKSRNSFNNNWKDIIKNAPRPITLEQKDKILKYNFLTRHNCHVPEDISLQANLAFVNLENAGDKVCAHNIYYDESVRIVTNLKENHKTAYENLISGLKEKLMPPDDPQHILDISNKNWQTSEFQDKVAVAAIQKKMRVDNLCQDVNLPMAVILEAFTTHVITNSDDN